MSMHRSPGEGNIYQKSGSWYASLMDGYTNDGKRNIIRFHSKSRKDILNQIARYRADKAKYFSPDSKILFSIWADHWFESICQNLQDSTQLGYTYTLNKLKDAFGKQKLCDIKTINVNEFLSQMQADGYSYDTGSKLKIMMGQIMEAAIDNELIFLNPAKRAKKLTRASFAHTQKRHQTKDAWSDDEFFAILHNLPDDRLGKVTKLMEITGERTLTPHCFRHTYVTRMMINGVPLEIIMANTGHASAVTAQPYMHFGMDAKAKAAEQLCKHITQEP